MGIKMAVGKGSMERAAKTAAGVSEKPQAVEKKEPAAVEKAAPVKAVEPAKKAAPAKKAPLKKAAAKSAGKANAAKAVSVIAAPTEEVMEKIVYQTSDGMLDRDAKPNENFGLGDAMPVYYF